MPQATSSDGTTIHYEVLGGRGPWAVLVQGLGLSSRFWVDQPALVAREGYRVLVLDNRGTGRSMRVRRPYPMARMAEDVVAAMDAAGAESAGVVGISLGGMVVQELALRFPARVRGLVLLATTPGLPHGRLPRPKALVTLTQVPRLVRAGRSAEAYRRLFFSTRPETEAKPLLDRLLAGWGALPHSERTEPLDHLLQLRAAMAHSTGFRLRRLDLPVHVATGSDDVVIPAENARILARLVKGATLEVLPGVGHAVPVEDPEVVVRGLGRVLEGRAA